MIIIKKITKRQSLDTEFIGVPKDRLKRQLFFMKQSLNITRGGLNHHSGSVDQIGAKLKTIIPASFEYQTVSIKQRKYTQLLTKDSNLLDDFEQLINCIIEFNHCSMLVISFDFFAHNQPLIDDYAFGILSSDI